MSTETSEMVTIPRAELEALKAEVRRLRRAEGRAEAIRLMQADAGPGDSAPVLTQDQLAEAWGVSASD